MVCWSSFTRSVGGADALGRLGALRLRADSPRRWRRQLEDPKALNDRPNVHSEHIRRADGNMKEMRDLGRRLWSTVWRSRPFLPNGQCPLCGRPVVLHASTRIGTWTGPMMAQRTKQEQIAACSVHGRPPFNDLSTKVSNRAGKAL